ncbi:hypothetical protein [Agromyces tropicus]|uniref:hypothetical protein n=1 Tax=Agromyces tropicus TaxID=555371 RepID=UPI0031D25622
MRRRRSTGKPTTGSPPPRPARHRGNSAVEATRIVRSVRAEAEVRPHDEAAFWGREIDDER